MQGVVDADTHIAEPEAMWKLIDDKMAPRRPVLVGLPDDTWFGDRNALWLIDGQYFSQAGGQGELSTGHAVGAEGGKSARRYRHRQPRSCQCRARASKTWTGSVSTYR